MSDVDRLLAVHMNRLRGQLCGLIEAYGLSETQERGAISTLKTLSYELQEDLSEYLHSSEHSHSE